MTVQQANKKTAALGWIQSYVKPTTSKESGMKHKEEKKTNKEMQEEGEPESIGT